MCCPSRARVAGIDGWGDVVVYNGTCKIAFDVAGDVSTIPPPKSKAYLVINFSTGEVGRRHFYARDGHKRFVASTPFLLRVGTALLPNGGSATVMSEAAANEAAGGYTFVMDYLSGDNTTANFTERAFTMSIQAQPTIQANNAGQTVQQVLDALSAALQQKGHATDPG